MNGWAWLLAAWCVGAPIVAFVIGRDIAVGELFSRPQIVSAPRIVALRTPSPESVRPDGSGQTRRQDGPSPDEPMPTGDAFMDRFHTPGLLSPPLRTPRRNATERDR